MKIASIDREFIALSNATNLMAICMQIKIECGGDQVQT